MKNIKDINKLLILNLGISINFLKTRNKFNQIKYPKEIIFKNYSIEIRKECYGITAVETRQTRTKMIGNSDGQNASNQNSREKFNRKIKGI